MLPSFKKEVRCIIGNCAIFQILHRLLTNVFVEEKKSIRLIFQIKYKDIGVILWCKKIIVS